MPVDPAATISIVSFGDVKVALVDTAIVGTGPEALVIVIPAPAVRPVTSPVPNDCHAAPS